MLLDAVPALRRFDDMLGALRALFDRTLERVAASSVLTAFKDSEAFETFLASEDELSGNDRSTDFSGMSTLGCFDDIPAVGIIVHNQGRFGVGDYCRHNMTIAPR